MKPYLLLAPLLLLSPRAAPASPVLDRIVAVVDTQPIFLSEVRAREKAPAEERQRLAPPPSRGANEHERESLLEAMIEALLVRQDAARRGISVTDEELRQAIEARASANGTSLDGLYGAMKAAGWTRERFDAHVRYELLARKWILSRAKALGSDGDEAFVRKELAALRARSYVEVRSP